MRITTLFSGFGGSACGARLAVLDVAQGVELDPAIAAVYNANFKHKATVRDFLTVAPDELDRTEVLQVSPECSRFTLSHSEGDLDLKFGEHIARHLDYQRPQFFVLENVRQYANSNAIEPVIDQLRSMGYSYSLNICNMAHYGLPQSRIRLFLLAARWHRPRLPRMVVFPNSVNSAIEDLIEGFRQVKFTKWQLSSIPKQLTRSIVIQKTGASKIPNTDRYRIQMCELDRPAWTVRALGKRSPNQLGTPHWVQMQLWVPSGIDRDDIPWNRNGKLLDFSARAYARLQGFPDEFVLPDDQVLATRGVGGAVPPSFIRQIFEANL